MGATNNKWWIISFTMIFIGLVFFYYFFVYVQNQEKEVIANDMRIVSQMNKNVYSSLENHYKIFQTKFLTIEKSTPKPTPSPKKTRTPNYQIGQKQVSFHYQNGWMSLEESLRSDYHPTQSSAPTPSKPSPAEQPAPAPSDTPSAAKTTVPKPTTQKYSVSEKQIAFYYSHGDSVAVFNMDNSAFFSNPLITRKDVFDFVLVTNPQHPDGPKTLYTNNPHGNINLTTDSIAYRITSMGYFELDLGYEQYIAFSTALKGTNGLYLTGCVNISAFNNQKREVSVFMITIVAILIILMILGLPILKLKIMSNVERLYISDVFFAGTSIIIGSAVWILLFLFFTSNLSYEHSNQKEKLRRLNRRVHKGIHGELSAIIEQMNSIKNVTHADVAHMQGADTVKVREQIRKHPFFGQFEAPHLNRDITGFANISQQGGGLLDRFPYSNGFFWTDTKGKMRVSLSNFTEPEKASLDLKHRQYITDIIKGEGMIYGEDSLMIAIESIRSITDGTYEVGVGMYSGNPALPVFAQHSTTVTLMDPIMEVGYGFCVFDDKGNTLFHSDKTRNLNENFLDETQNEFDRYLPSHVERFASVKYAGNRHYMYIRPFEQFPGYHLATFVDHQYVRSPNAIALNVTIEMLFAFYLLLSVCFVVIYLVTNKRVKLKQSIFPFNWMRPYYDSQGSYERIYFRLLLTNALGMLYLVLTWYWFRTYMDLLIHSVLFVAIVLMCTHYYVLSTHLPYAKRVYTHFADTSRPKTLFAIVLFLVALSYAGRIYIYDFVRMTGGGILLNEALVLVFLGSVIGIIYSLFGKNQAKPWGEHLRTMQNAWFKIKKFTVYKYYCFSWVMVLSIFPTMIFFAINFHTEKEVLYKHNILSVKQKSDGWVATKMLDYYNTKEAEEKFKIKDPQGFMRNMNQLAWPNPCNRVRVNGDYIQIDPKDTVQNAKFVIPKGYNHVTRNVTTTPQLRASLFHSYYDHIRVHFDDYGEASQGYLTDAAVDSSWMYAYEHTDSITYSSVFFESGKDHLKISTPAQSLMSIVQSNWVVHVLFVMILMVVIYRILEYCVHRIFGLDFKDYSDELISQRSLSSYAEQIIKISDFYDGKSSSFNNSLVVGVNAAHIFVIREKLREMKKAYFISIDLFDLNEKSLEMGGEVGDSSIDHTITQLYLLSKKGDKQNKELLQRALKEELSEETPMMVFIEHFEYAYNDLAYNRKKMLILQRLVDNPVIRVVISSDINPRKMYNYYEDAIEQLQQDLHKNDNTLLSKRIILDQINVDYQKWMHLLGGFYRITVPFESLDISEREAPQTYPEVIESELNNGMFLQRLKKHYVLHQNKGVINEDYTLNIQEYASSYYFSIWNSLSREERFIVYDIARDKFVNTNNTDGIIDLLHKGILQYDHSLRLMNESFTNFILSQVNSNESLERELESRKKGKWGTASAVIALLILSLIIFLSYGKISAMNDISTLLGSLGAVITLFLRVSGIFSFGKGS
ncbi:hypothetical protein BFP72_07490 [Reichenbachiella sp. 5M10]|uniref:cache domain-containing protein n=1 Tax=Reichenbachiella sp. 5M10 TaxID=1889772 RepID=UPI000C158A71|nr:cache domain-containing protein [Reichenbachiella sp. 5M10]PIB35249.1 hypothetical protein BFP72_07490 [Reichenbachiella sp. 5M10]